MHKISIALHIAATLMLVLLVAYFWLVRDIVFCVSPSRNEDENTKRVRSNHLKDASLDKVRLWPSFGNPKVKPEVHQTVSVCGV